MQRLSFNLTEDGFLHGFTWVDYVMFCGMLVTSLIIGVYYAFKSKKKENEEFLLGGRSMSCFPVAMSLVASYISAILVLGGPSESYYHNVSWWLLVVGFAVLPISAFVFIPFIYKLHITSIYEYLEKRYESRWVRRMASAMFVIQIFFYEAVAIYAPALALSSVMNIPVWVSILTIAVIASVYTAIGGMKAVVWTDVLQLCVILGCMITIVVTGSINVGGFSKVWDIAIKHNRTGPNIAKLGFDLYERHTVANVILWSIFQYMMLFTFSQTSIQRYLSLKSLTHAKMSVFIVSPLIVTLYTLSAFTGLVIFASYEGCDPLAAGLITSKDQLVPFYIMDRLSHIPGLPGLFVACVLSGALSTISSAVSSQAAVTWEDWLSMVPTLAALSPISQTYVTKLVALGYGTLAVGLSFLVGNLGGVLQTAQAFIGSISGPLFAVFIMALFMPFSNSKGIIVAMVMGMAGPLTVNLGASSLGLKPQLLPTSTDSCPLALNIPPPKPPPMSIDDIDYPEKLFGISYKHITPMGFIITLVSGILVSLLTGRSGGRRVKRSLVHPWVRWALDNDEEVNKIATQNSNINPIVIDDELISKDQSQSQSQCEPNTKFSDDELSNKNITQSFTKL